MEFLLFLNWQELTRFKNSWMERSATIPRGIVAGISRWIHHYLVCIFNGGTVETNLFTVESRRKFNSSSPSPIEKLFFKFLSENSGKTRSLALLSFVIPARTSPRTHPKPHEDNIAYFDEVFLIKKKKKFNFVSYVMVSQIISLDWKTRSIYAKITTSILRTGNCGRERFSSRTTLPNRPKPSAKRKNICYSGIIYR